MTLINQQVDSEGFIGGMITVMMFFESAPTTVTMEVYDPYLALVDTGTFTRLSARTYLYEYQSLDTNIDGTYRLVTKAVTSTGKTFLTQYETDLDYPAPNTLL